MPKLIKPISKSKLLKKLRNKCKKLWRESVFKLWNGKCIICGSTHLPNAHHIVPRIFMTLRYNPINGILLCPSHHKFNCYFSAHKNSLWFVLILMQKISIEILNYLNEIMKSELTFRNIFDAERLREDGEKMSATDKMIEYHNNELFMLENDVYEQKFRV